MPPPPIHPGLLLYPAPPGPQSGPFLPLRPFVELGFKDLPGPLFSDSSSQWDASSLPLSLTSPLCSSLGKNLTLPRACRDDGAAPAPSHEKTFSTTFGRRFFLRLLDRLPPIDCNSPNTTAKGLVSPFFPPNPFWDPPDVVGCLF